MLPDVIVTVLVLFVCVFLISKLSKMRQRNKSIIIASIIIFTGSTSEIVYNIRSRCSIGLDCNWLDFVVFGSIMLTAVAALFISFFRQSN